jgi:maintenance of mitochondrial morphology protein 1
VLIIFQEITFDTTYQDSISVSLSTSYLFNYPITSFARLPVALTISLSMLQSKVSVSSSKQELTLIIEKVSIIPPSQDSPAPMLTFSISPDFHLDLLTTSLMGSRAKLANVPKLHELIQHQVRRTLAAKGTWKVVLPGLANVAEAKEQVRKELEATFSEKGNLENVDPAQLS